MNQSVTDTPGSGGRWAAWNKRFGLVAITLILLVTGIWGAKESGSRADIRFRQDLIRQASAVAATIPIDEARVLSFTEADQDLPEFQRISGQLKAYSRATGLRCLYTMALRDGQLFFGPEGIEADSPLSSPVGTLYEEPAPGDFEIFDTAEPAVLGPHTDEYGPYISASAPVIDPLSGEVIMVVGLDEDPNNWQAEVWKARLVPLLIPLLGFMILGLSMLITRRRLHGRTVQKRHYHVTEAIACAAIMLLLTAGISLLIRQMDRSSRDEVLNSQAQMKANTYADAFHDAHTRLKALASAFASSDYISRAEFAAYYDESVTTALIRESAWLPEVPADAVASFEENVRAEDLPGYTVRTTGTNAQERATMVYPVLYVQPADATPYLGSDAFGDPEARLAIEQCMLCDHPTATPASAAEESSGPSQGIRVFHRAASRRQTGIISLTIDPSRVEQSAVRRTPGLSVSLLEIAPDGSVRSLVCGLRQCKEECAGYLRAAHKRVFPFFSFGRTYALLVAPETEWHRAHPLRNQQIAWIAGLILTVLSTGLVGSLANRPVVLEKMILDQTADLRKSEDRFAMAASAAGIGIWDLDLTNGTIHWDRRMYTLYGIEPQQFAGTYEAWTQLIHPDDRENVLKVSNEALKGEPSFNLMFRIIRPDERVRYIRAFAKVIYDESGKAVRTTGVNVDVTDDKEREARIVAQLDELNRWQTIIVGREHRILELKAEVNNLRVQLDLLPRYRETIPTDEPRTE